VFHKWPFVQRPPRLALFEHPVFEIELFADDLEGLVQDLAGVLICPRPDGQVDYALPFGFQVNGHRVSCFQNRLFSCCPQPYAAVARGIN
jgi:hypothetical protein